MCEYSNDEWSSVVQIRLNECIDLVATEAIYHEAYYSRFTQNKKRSSITPLFGGRPVNKTLSEVFYELCENGLIHKLETPHIPFICSSTSVA